MTTRSASSAASLSVPIKRALRDTGTVSVESPEDDVQLYMAMQRLMYALRADPAVLAAIAEALKRHEPEVRGDDVDSWVECSCGQMIGPGPESFYDHFLDEAADALLGRADQ